MSYKLAIFDLDGTLLDTLEDLKNSTNYALRQYGLAERTIDEIRAIVGHGIRNLIERAVPEGTPESVTDKVFDCFREHYKVHCADKTAPYPGTADLLKKLRASKVKVAVISNKADPAVRELMPVYFDGLYDIARGELPGVPKKPAPDGVRKIMEELGTDPGKAVYIGDSEVDVATAENSGIDQIIVTWGFRSREQLKAAGAVRLADDADEVYRLIMKRRRLCPGMRSGKIS